MGFLSGIGAAIVGGIKGFAAKVMPAIAGFTSKIGGALKGFADKFIAGVSSLGLSEEKITETVKSVGNIVHLVAGMQGIESESDPAVLGAKAGKAEKNIDDFDNKTEDYISYLKNDVKLDTEKFDKLSSVSKTACSVVGITLEVKAVEERIGKISISPESLSLLASLIAAGITVEPGKLLNVVISLKDAGVKDMSDVSDYFTGKGDSDRMQTGDALRTALGEDADEKICRLKEAVRSTDDEA